MKNILVILLTFSIFKMSFGQADHQSIDSTVNRINEYIKMIDSDNSLYEGISEGSIVDNGVKGEFSTYSSYNSETKELYRIFSKEVTDKILNYIFYYQDDKLIYAKVEKKRLKNDENIVENTQQVYFEKKDPIWEIGSVMETSKLREIGLRHLKTHNEIHKIN